MGWSSLSKSIGNIVHIIRHIDQHKHLILTEVASLPLSTYSLGEVLSCLAAAFYISVGLLSRHMGRGRILYLSSNTVSLVGP